MLVYQFMLFKFHVLHYLNSSKQELWFWVCFKRKDILHSSDEHTWRRKSNDWLKPECLSQNNFADEGELLKGMKKIFRDYDGNIC